MSRISKFGPSLVCFAWKSRGPGHWGQVDPGKKGEAADDGGTQVYEWGCPFQGEWSENKFESGPGDDQCRGVQ